ncbi:hypothetical protein pipiens_019626 [Culex pipiens pipiens]|uniref:Uncharacterized protein n=1 Tax=Culex pipiens pipiens TaxID=38569 RepID=A0ABD1DX10_CULPP
MFLSAGQHKSVGQEFGCVEVAEELVLESRVTVAQHSRSSNRMKSPSSGRSEENQCNNSHGQPGELERF